MLKADLHVHTRYSMDSESSLEKIIARCTEIGINCIAIADHGTVEGALKLRKMAPFPVIVAEEILTPNGEIMGMFLEETIPSKQSIENVIKSIRDQGGLVSIPHPYDPFRGLKIDKDRFAELKPNLDLVEVFNARCLVRGALLKAKKLSDELDIPGSAGSDAHTTSEIGNAYVEMPEFNDKDEFLSSLKQGIIKGHHSSILVHLNSTIAKIKNLL